MKTIYLVNLIYLKSRFWYKSVIQRTIRGQRSEVWGSEVWGSEVWGQRSEGVRGQTSEGQRSKVWGVRVAGELLAGWMGYGRDLPSSNRDQFGPGIGWSVSVHCPKRKGTHLCAPSQTWNQHLRGHYSPWTLASTNFLNLLPFCQNHWEFLYVDVCTFQDD